MDEKVTLYPAVPFSPIKCPHLCWGRTAWGVPRALCSSVSDEKVSGCLYSKSPSLPPQPWPNAEGHAGGLLLGLPSQLPSHSQNCAWSLNYFPIHTPLASSSNSLSNNCSPNCKSMILQRQSMVWCCRLDCVSPRFIQ